MKLKFIALSAFIGLFCFTVNAQSGRKSVQPNEPQNQTQGKQENKKEGKQGEIRPVKIIRKPAPDVNVFGSCFRNEGFSYVQTVLRLTFDASAEITNVKIIKPSGCDEFDEESVSIARKIKFEPAVQDGKPITVAKTVVYVGGIL